MTDRHIRKATQRRTPASLHRDPRDRLPFTLCGAPITARDWDIRRARSKKNREAVDAGTCADCRQIAGVIAARFCCAACMAIGRDSRADEVNR